ncbi:MAG: hypothetical protein KDB64_09510, partial [Solirubrobacterales bacterium]|nr:hypothetical protein [Solirubrobacterales bacterium]
MPARLRLSAWGLGLLAALCLVMLVTPCASAKISVFPSPGTPVASDTTTFSFRDVKPNRLGPVRIIGSVSGEHAIARRIKHSDRNGVSLVPAGRFADGEESPLRRLVGIAGRDHDDGHQLSGLVVPMRFCRLPLVPFVVPVERVALVALGGEPYVARLEFLALRLLDSGDRLPDRLRIGVLGVFQADRRLFENVPDHDAT